MHAMPSPSSGGERSTITESAVGGATSATGTATTQLGSESSALRTVGGGEKRRQGRRGGAWQG